MGILFGTDGVRGIANRDLSPELALKLGRAAALFMKDKSGRKSTFLIGKDTRLSSDMLEGALCAGITSTGADVLLAGTLPTPAVAYLSRNAKITGGVMITASHNPMEYNGIKFFSRDGFKLSDEAEKQIEDMVLSDEFKPELPCGQDLGQVKHYNHAKSKYKQYVKSLMNFDFSGLLVAVDCANGASFDLAPEVLAELGANVVAFNTHPNGSNINANCGSTYPGLLQDVMKTGKFDVGLAFDGDADRLIAVDNTGEVVDGDMMLSIFAKTLAAQGKLPENTVVATVMSNMGLEKALSDENIKLIRSNVGDRYVLTEMIKSGSVIGGEQSGHIIFLEYNTTGDGIITGCMLLKFLKESGKHLSELKNLMTVFPQVTKNIRNERKSEILRLPDWNEYIAKKNQETGGNYRILVRPSGTEPLIRVMAEGPDRESTTVIVEEICNKIESLG
ncbi:MAG: phosphoglucosamine mutase [Firmicutes bacterium]|nr:phosphoglucosamine mutase [Bacillota bacterium]